MPAKTRWTLSQAEPSLRGALELREVELGEAHVKTVETRALLCPCLLMSCGTDQARQAECLRQVRAVPQFHGRANRSG